MSTPLQKNVVIVLFGQARDFDDVALPLFYALRRLGYDCSIAHNRWQRQGSHILMGLCDASDLNLSQLPKDSIIYNLEQLVPGSKGVRPDYLEACRRFRVWDYSLLNVKRFVKDYGITSVEHVPLGYTPEMTRLDPNYPKDIDVLFYGDVNERRLAVINQLRAQNINAMPFCHVYGLTRDILIARSRLVLNVHYYLPGIQEIVRLGYLWANQKCVVCERNSDSFMHTGYESCCLYAPYEQLVDTVRLALEKPDLLQSVGETAFAEFSAKSYTEILEARIGPAPKTSAPEPRKTLPTTLNIGTGQSFMDRAINIASHPRFGPDIVLDISQTLSLTEVYETKRFGQVTLRQGQFQRIYLYDILPTVTDLIQTMTNCLTLLKEGGTLRLGVPYELSLAAWQNPNHKHAFNEKSWLSYTDYFWTLGWREARFELLDLTYTLSDYGKELALEGFDETALLRQARAVDAMQVLLKKRATTFEEKMLFDTETRAIYRQAEADWSTSPDATSLRQKQGLPGLLKSQTCQK
ncbi:MAG: hypothetical protein K6G15_03105 [Desulfovibrio sp.]|nr:hypothetical protein [Desulfovibrio sp.]